MKLLKTLLASAVAVSAMPALSYEAGDIIIKAGLAHVAPKDDNLKLGGGNTIEVESDTAIGITATYMITPKVGVELLAATPFKHDIELNGDKVAETKHLPPTLTAQYYLMDPASKIQPYVGLGVNHTFFFEEDGVVSHLGKSWGIAYQAGVNYDIDDRFLANVAVWKMDIDAELNDGGDDVEIDPLVFMVGAGMKF